MDQSNPHIISSPLDLNDYGVLKVSYLFKIAYHHEDNLRIHRELKYRKEDNGEREELFGDENVINWIKLKCCRNKIRKVFVRLGTTKTRGDTKTNLNLQ